MRKLLLIISVLLMTSINLLAAGGKTVQESMLVEKKTFALESFQFEHSGRKIPVKIGYETYGRLNEKKDNAILLCHYFTGQSHAAGKYRPEDTAAGWWDKLIGPGKVIDTERWFVICSDTIGNINANNPSVVTTGPSTINPETGRPYGMDFPIFTLKDAIRVQRLLVQSLGISRLNLVLGPSMGGLQSFMWARHYPEMVGAVVSVFATPVIRPMGLMVPNQLGIEAIRLDPKWNNGDYYGKEPPNDGLLLAFKILLTSTRTDHWANVNFGRKLSEVAGALDPFKSFAGRFLVEDEIEKIVVGRMQFFDPNAYVYIAKANTLFDLREDSETYQQALAHLKMPVLMIIDESDLLFTMDQANEALQYLPDGQVFNYDSKNGHLSCLFETDYFADRLKSFVDKL